MLNNLIKKRIKTIMADSSIRIPTTSVDNINSLFEKGILDEVTLLSLNKK